MSTFLDAVIARAQEHPERVAFSNTRGEALTFGQLDAQSTALALYLAQRNPQRNPVALYGHKEAAMLVGMFACMKAGCAYVPIDPEYPAARIEFMIQDAGVPLILTQEQAEGFVAALPGILDTAAAASAAGGK